MALSQAAMAKLRAAYVATLPAKVATARTLLARLERGDSTVLEEARIFGHNLHGSGSSYGWPEISESGRRVQDAEASKLVPAARALLATLERAVDQAASGPGEA